MTDPKRLKRWTPWVADDSSSRDLERQLTQAYAEGWAAAERASLEAEVERLRDALRQAEARKDEMIEENSRLKINLRVAQDALTTARGLGGEEWHETSRSPDSGSEPQSAPARARMEEAFVNLQGERR